MKALPNHRFAIRAESPQLRFSPTAWAKLLFLRDRGMSEVGGFGVSRPDDLLYVEDIQTVEQVCSVVTVQFNDDAVAQFFDAQVDAGRQPSQFARIWIHTHPEISAQPSLTDEETFLRVFGRTDWAVMFILSKTDEAFCRLRFNVGPGGDLEIPVSVDYQNEFAGSDFSSWEAEYRANVQVMPERPKTRPNESLILEADQAQANDVADNQTAAGNHAPLRDYLRRRCGWSSDEIDGQLELGWSLEELVEFCRHETDSVLDFSDTSEALFTA
jgi:proteasome lid subunit RPN8/RPN11